MARTGGCCRCRGGPAAAQQSRDTAENYPTANAFGENRRARGTNCTAAEGGIAGEAAEGTSGKAANCSARKPNGAKDQAVHRAAAGVRAPTPDLLRAGARGAADRGVQMPESPGQSVHRHSEGAANTARHHQKARIRRTRGAARR